MAVICFSRRRGGVIIGSYIDPILSDLFSAGCVRRIDELREQAHDIKAFRHVDDYLVLHSHVKESETCLIDRQLAMLNQVVVACLRRKRGSLTSFRI